MVFMGPWLARAFADGAEGPVDTELASSVCPLEYFKPALARIGYFLSFIIKSFSRALRLAIEASCCLGDLALVLEAKLLPVKSVVGEDHMSNTWFSSKGLAAAEADEDRSRARKARVRFIVGGNGNMPRFHDNGAGRIYIIQPSIYYETSTLMLVSEECGHLAAAKPHLQDSRRNGCDPC